MSVSAVLVLIASAAVRGVAAASPCPNSTSDWQPAPLQWTNCTGLYSGLDCATLQVPIDWTDPYGEQTTLSMNRLRAKNPSARIGNLFINYGGPGGPSTEVVLGYKYNVGGEVYLSDALRDNFDIIGLDPRGVGKSSPILCDRDIVNERISLLPETDAEFNALVAHNQALGQSCLQMSGNLVRHVDTLSVARDFEAVRIAAGGEKMNFLGLSYGTMIAAAYAGLFPDNIRAMVLDGNVDHDQRSLYSVMVESQTYESVLGIFAEWCSNNSTCVLHGQDVGAVIDDVLAAAEKSPIPVPDPVGAEVQPNVTATDVRFNMQQYLLAEQFTWATLGQALSDAKNNNGTLLASPLLPVNATEQLETPSVQINLWGTVIGCLEWPHPSRNVQDVKYLSQTMAELSPRTQGATQGWTYAVGCLGWPFPLQNPPHPADVHGTPELLMVNALHDPETSYLWAEGLRLQIENATLLTRNGSGHISYYLAGEASAAIDAYLVNITVPAQNSVVQT